MDITTVANIRTTLLFTMLSVYTPSFASLKTFPRPNPDNRSHSLTY
jgi:hypothetical protein